MLAISPSLKASFNGKENENNEDDQIANHISTLQRKLKRNQSIIDIPFVNNDDMLHLVIYALEKETKTKEDILLISHYFSSIKQFKNISHHKKAIIEPIDLLNQLAQKMSLEVFSANHIICRIGDYGNKFYLILKGRVSIIYKKEHIVHLTYDNYINHLKKLVSIGEISLAESIISLNKGRTIDNELFKSIDDYKAKKQPRNDSNTLKDYIDQSMPIIEQNPEKEECVKHKIKLIVYSYICDLESNQTFGDIALRNDKQTRTATIISNEDCIFGVITKKIYDKFIKDTQERIRNSNITSVLTSKVFDGINIQSFINKYFNYFREFKLNQRAVLFSQGEPRNELFFLKEGEIEITTNQSFKDLTSLIKQLKGSISIKKEQEILQNLYMKNYDQYILKKKTHKMLCIKENELIGYDEYMHDGKYYCNAISNSHNCVLFSIPYSVFIEMKDKFELINKNIPIYLESRRKVISERLITLRKMEMDTNIKPFVIDIDKSGLNFGSNNNKNAILNKTINKLKFDQFTNKITMKKSNSSFNNNTHTKKVLIKGKISKKIMASVMKSSPSLADGFNVLSRNKDMNNDDKERSNLFNQRNFNNSGNIQGYLLKDEEGRGGKDIGYVNNAIGYPKMKKNLSTKALPCKLAFKDLKNKSMTSSTSSYAILLKQAKIRNSILDKILNMSTNLSLNKIQGQSLYINKTISLIKDSSLNLNKIDFLAIDKLYEAYEMTTKRPQSRYSSFPLKKMFNKATKFRTLNRTSLSLV